MRFADYVEAVIKQSGYQVTGAPAQVVNFAALSGIGMQLERIADAQVSAEIQTASGPRLNTRGVRDILPRIPAGRSARCQSPPT